MTTSRSPKAGATSNYHQWRKHPIAVLDACVLVPMPVADTLLHLAEPPALYHARWSEEILAEVTRTLIVRFGKSREKALYREAAMREFFSGLDRREL